jgi:hypothetical protein
LNLPRAVPTAPAWTSTEWDEPQYVSVKCRDRDGYIVEAAALSAGVN